MGESTQGGPCQHTCRQDRSRGPQRPPGSRRSRGLLPNLPTCRHWNRQTPRGSCAAWPTRSKRFAVAASGTAFGLPACRRSPKSLLQERDGARILGTLARYLRQVFNFEEVLVLRRLPRSSTWVGYHACRKHSSTTHLGAVGWRPEWAQPLPSPRTFTEACSGLEGQEREDLADPAAYQVVVPLEGRGVNQVPAADADEAGGIRSVCSASRHLPPTGRSPVGAPTTSGAASKASSRRFGTER